MISRALIIYAGDEPDIITYGKEYFQRKSGPLQEFQFENRALTSPFNFAEVLNQPLNLIILDFTNPFVIKDDLVHQLSIFKNHRIHRQIVLAGLFKDKASLNESTFLQHFGLTYMFIKGNDFSILFDDLFYLSFDENPGFRSFALVKNFQLPYRASFPGLIQKINSNTLRVSCDMETDVNSLEVHYEFLNEKRRDLFPVESIYMGSDSGNDLVTYDLNFPYPGAWEEVTPETLQQDTVETFVDSSEILSKLKPDCLIWSTREVFFGELLSLKNDFDVEIHFEQHKLKDRIQVLSPELIILDPDSSDEIHLILENILPLNKSTLLIIFNTNDDVLSTRNKYGHERLLTHPVHCQKVTLEMLLRKQGQKLVSQKPEFKAIGPSHPGAQVSIPIELTITSLSEHEITFFCPLELPMYSNINFDVPVSCQVLIIPPLRELHRGPIGVHYMGIIHGIDQEDASYLRKFVNQVIFSPLKKFERITIKTEDVKPPEIQIPVQEEVKVESIESRNFKRRTFNKSKL